MGAPKQKWTAEEEAALKAGVNKHGAGKWRTILKDPEYSGVLAMRSNVDLKDKWRNMSVMNNGWGSRDKSRLVIKRAAQSARQEENLTSASDVPMSDEDTVDTHPSAMDTSGTSTPAQVSAPPKKSIVRLDNLIMEAISNLKEPSGSNKTSIASYIEDKYWIPADFKRLLSAKLIFLVSTGKLLKVKRCYRIAPYSSSSERRRNLPMITQDGRQLNSPRDERDDQIVVTRSQIDVELAKMRSMTAQEAGAAAARAVAEAEAAIAEAEEAAREAEAAEADAQAAQAFAEEATRSLRGRIAQKVVIRA